MLERLDRYEMATIVQAQGPPLRRFGVPPGGPMDRQSWQPFAHESEVWELFGLATSHWQALQDGWICHSGMPRLFTFEGRAATPPFKVTAGKIVSVMPVIPGQVAYITLSDNPSSPILPDPVREVRILASIDKVDQAELLTRPFSISIHSNRCGMRVAERVAGVPDLDQSEPCTPGVVQCTPSGEIIVVGPDGPTIGGYRRIGALLETDTDKLARIGFNQAFRFVNAADA
ncbi:MAG: hypothetical protein IT206_03745 [Fimbriimonadaceae bacterium]|nr:hypothetical protein [Fimbriimonadaceae bacterium]